MYSILPESWSQCPQVHVELTCLTVIILYVIWYAMNEVVFHSCKPYTAESLKLQKMGKEPFVFSTA